MIKGPEPIAVIDFKRNLYRFIKANKQLSAWYIIPSHRLI